MRGGSMVVSVILLLNTILPAAPMEHPAKAELLANVATAEAAKPFQVGVRVTMKPGYHIYWIDPGDSGSPTQIKWNVPDGWKVEPLPFPTPHKLVMPGDIVNYGYADEVLFLANVTPPESAKGPVELSADVEWLVCDVNRCLPGKASPKLTVAVGEKADPANDELFQTWRDRLPTKAEGVTSTVTKTVAGAAPVLHYSILVPWKQPAKNVEVFLAPDPGWMIKDVKTGGDARRTSLAFTANYIGAKREFSEMTILIAYDDAGGVRRSVQFSDPLDKR